MSKKAYEFLDLLALTFITVLAECVDVYAFTKFNTQVYALSIACVMGMIAIYRWNAFGLVVPVAAGAAGIATRMLLQQNVTLGLWLAYTVGYLALSVCLLWFIKKDKWSLNKDPLFKYGYYFSGYMAVELLRAICQIGNGDFWTIALLYYALDLLNVLFGLLIWIIACKQETFVVDMNDYLVRLHAQPSSASVREEKQNQLSLEEMAEADDVNDAALLDGGTLSAEQLHQMDEPLNKTQRKTSRFDQENQAIEDYRKSKGKD
jgi:hypothetical protein